jgi:hypothetical protein
MPEQVRHDMHRRTRDQEQGCVHMPQAVQPGMWQRDLWSNACIRCPMLRVNPRCCRG